MNFKKSVSSKTLIAVASLSIAGSFVHADGIMDDYLKPAARTSLHYFALPGSFISSAAGSAWNFATDNRLVNGVTATVRNRTPEMVANGFNTVWGYGPEQVQNAWRAVQADPLKKDVFNVALTVAAGVAAYKTYLALEHNAHENNLAETDTVETEIKDLFAVYKKAEKDVNDFTATKTMFSAEEMEKLTELKNRFNEAKDALINVILKSKTYLERLKTVVSYYTPQVLHDLVAKFSKKAVQETKAA